MTSQVRSNKKLLCVSDIFANVVQYLTEPNVLDQQNIDMNSYILEQKGECWQFPLMTSRFLSYDVTSQRFSHMHSTGTVWPSFSDNFEDIFLKFCAHFHRSFYIRFTFRKLKSKMLFFVWNEKFENVQNIPKKSTILKQREDKSAKFTSLTAKTLILAKKNRLRQHFTVTNTIT